MGRKKNLSDAAIDDARRWAGRLVEMHARGSDREGALRRIEATYGIGYWTLWNLLYRTPKSIAADKLAAIRLAYLDRCEKQMRQLHHELEVERARGGVADDVLEDFEAEAAALARRLAEAKTKA